MRSDTRLGNPAARGAGQQPGLQRAGRITGPDGARAGLFAAG